MKKTTKKIIEWDTPCKLIELEGLHCRRDERTEKDFIRAVKTAVKADPKSPIRFDVHDSELPAINRAFEALAKGVMCTLDTSRHMDGLRRAAGFCRVCFLPPLRPRPKKSTACKTVNERRAAEDAAFCLRYTPAEVVELSRTNGLLALVDERPADDRRRSQEARRRSGKEHHRQAYVNGEGKTVADYKDEFRRWFKARGTATGAAAAVARLSGFNSESIRKYATRHHWTR